MSKHTPEPWVIRKGDWSTHATLITTAKRRRNKTVAIAEVDTDGFNKEFGDEQKANARRIVACVNACKGFATEELEVHTGPRLLHIRLGQLFDEISEQKGSRIYLSRQLHEATQQRDELLAALEAAVECGMVPTSSAADGGAMRHVRQVVVADQIRAAIASAKGGAS